MGVIAPVKAIEAISQAKTPADAKKIIFELVGNLDNVEVIGSQVLLGIYVRPEKTKGGIFLTDSAKEEDIWQGKVGLVLKWGPDAFRDENGDLYEQRAEVGDWGVFRINDTWTLKVGDMPCRLVADKSLRLKLKDPSIVF